MQSLPPPPERTEQRSRVTDASEISVKVQMMRASGHPEVAIWRYLLDTFVIDLDALAHTLRQPLSS